MKKVGIIMGSDSDLPILRKAMDTLESLGIPYECHIYSAHRTPEEARQLERGVMVDGRKTARAKVHILSVQNLFTDMIITIHEGRNRQVRKMVEQIGHQVVMLRRIRFGPLKLGELPRGMWRP